MKKLLIGLLLLGSFSVFAETTESKSICSVICVEDVYENNSFYSVLGVGSNQEQAKEDAESKCKMRSKNSNSASGVRVFTNPTTNILPSDLSNISCVNL